MLPADPHIHAQRVAEYIVDWMRGYALNAGQKGFVVGLSGGIDSALTAGLAARTGLEVLLVHLPIRQPANQVNRAAEWSSLLEATYTTVRSVVVDLNRPFDALIEGVSGFSGRHAETLAEANTRARLRMTTLYYLAATHGLLVAGTGNKVEDFGVGFYTKYGDGGVDLSPIADLLKTEVRSVAEAVGVPTAILNAEPTDGLWGDDRTDEDQLGASYPELERAMRQWENGVTAGELRGREAEVLALFVRLNRANAHKMNPIPVCTIPDSVRWAP
ncbi:NAD(+) synthase [bacterium]|nr:NAD(+) synthase [bacterium]